MTIFYLTRHGQTEWNIQKRFQGWLDSNLTNLGEKQAISLGKRLSDIKFDIVFSSSSQRAFQTAELVCLKRNLKIIKDPDLREINVRNWEGRTFEEIKADEKEFVLFDYFWNQPDKYIPTIGETFIDVKNRVISVIKRIKKNYPNKTILIISHGMVLKTILSYFENRPLKTFWHPPSIKNSSLSIIDWSTQKGKIIMYGDIQFEK